jgi:hypothetical protein
MSCDPESIVQAALQEVVSHCEAHGRSVHAVLLLMDTGSGATHAGALPAAGADRGALGGAVLVALRSWLAEHPEWAAVLERELAVASRATVAAPVVH